MMYRLICVIHRDRVTTLGVTISVSLEQSYVIQTVLNSEI